MSSFWRSLVRGYFIVLRSDSGVLKMRVISFQRCAFGSSRVLPWRFAMLYANVSCFAFGAAQHRGDPWLSNQAPTC